MTSAPDPARARFFAIQFARLSGVLVVFLGMAVSQTDLVFDGGAPILGGVLMLLGLVEFALVPKLLARKWRTPVSSEVEKPQP